MTESRNEYTGSGHIVSQVGSMYGDIYMNPSSTTRSPRWQAPAPPPHYTNNAPQLAAIRAALSQRADGVAVPTVVVVTGPPGGGKSATVYQAAFEHYEDFPDGVFYASLGGTSEDGESAALAQFLIRTGHSPDQIPASVEARAAWFRDWSSDKRIAVVIDDAVRPAQVRTMLPGAGRSVVLVTAAGDLSGLAASTGAVFVDLTPLTDDAARELLRRIAGAERIDAETDAVGTLLTLCHGSALALSVSAAMILGSGEGAVSRLVARLSRHGRLLESLSRDPDLSVRTVFDTAAERLPERVHRCYLAFGQHPGTAAVGVEVLAAGVDADVEDVRDDLDRLVATNLVVRTRDGRYWANGLVTEHARVRAASDQERADEARAMHDRQRRYYRVHALCAGQVMIPGREWLREFWRDLRLDRVRFSEDDARAWLERERASLRALIEEDYEAGREDVCQLAIALWPLHERGKHLDDLDVVNDHAAEIAEHRNLPQVRALALIQRGFAFRAWDDNARAADLFELAVDLAAKHGTGELYATAVEALALAFRDLGRTEKAQDLLRDNLGRAESLGYPRRIALARMHLGSVAPATEALALLDAARREFTARAEHYNVSKTQSWHGQRLVELGRYQESDLELRAALEFMSEHGHHFDAARVRAALADLAVAQGEVDTARDQFHAALSIYRTLGMKAQAELISARLADLG